MKNFKIHISFFFLFFTVSGFSQIVVQSQDKKATLPYGIKNEKQWAKVQQKWENRNYQAYMYIENDKILEGQILFRNDTGVYYLNSLYDLINPLEIEENTGFVPYSEIEKIIIHDYWRNKKGIKTGALIGGVSGIGFGILLAYAGLGASYSLVPIVAGSLVGVGLPTMSIIENHTYDAPDIVAYGNKKKSDIDLSKYSIFPDYLPPTLELTPNAVKVKNGQNEFLPTKDFFNAAPSVKRVFNRPTFSIFPHFINGSLNNMVGHEGIGASINFSHRHSLEYQYGNMDHFFTENLSLVNHTESSHIETHGVNYSAKLLSRGEFQYRKLEVFLSGGPTLSSVQTDVSYTLQTEGANSVAETVGYITESQVNGLRIMAGTDYYFSKYLSIRVSYGHHEMNKVEIPENLSLHPSTNTLKGVEAHEVNLTSRDFYWGVRVHF